MIRDPRRERIDELGRVRPGGRGRRDGVVRLLPTRIGRRQGDGR